MCLSLPPWCLPSRWARSILQSGTPTLVITFLAISIQFSPVSVFIPTMRRLFRRENRSCLFNKLAWLFCEVSKFFIFDSSASHLSFKAEFSSRNSFSCFSCCSSFFLNSCLIAFSSLKILSIDESRLASIDCVTLSLSLSSSSIGRSVILGRLEARLLERLDWVLARSPFFLF